MSSRSVIECLLPFFCCVDLRILSCASVAVGVANDPNPVTAVGSVEGNSWNNKRLDAVTFAFQVKVDLLEYHASVPSNEAANILTDNPPWMKLSYDAKHLRPEVAIIFCTSPFAGGRKRLTGEAACEDICSDKLPGAQCLPTDSLYFFLCIYLFGDGSMFVTVGVNSKLSDVRNNLCFRPVFFENCLCKWFIVAKYVLYPPLAVNHLCR